MSKVLSLTLLLLVVVVSVVSAEEALERRRHDEILADIKNVKHPKFRRATPVAPVYQASIEKLRKYWLQILDDAMKATEEALKKSNPANLNDDQRMAVYLYTMPNAFYRLLNTKLREGNGAGEFQDYVDLLMSALNKIGKTGPVTVWRVLLDIQLNHSIGDSLSWTAFSSTATIEGVFPVCTGVSTQYEILEAYGYDIKAYSKYPSEEELLLPPNTVLEVVEGPTDCQNQKQYILKMSSADGNTQSLAVSLTVSVYNGVWLATVIIVSSFSFSKSI